MTNDKKNGFERLDSGRNSKSVEWKQLVEGEKQKCKMKIKGGEKKI